MAREPDRQLVCPTCTEREGKPTVTTHNVYSYPNGVYTRYVCTCEQCGALNPNCGSVGG